MFLEMGQQWANTSTNDRTAFISYYSANPNIINRIEIVEEYYPQLKNKGLLAWDLSRCIALCRRAYTAGYLEREEAWDMIMPIAQRIQPLFDSWEDLGENYLLGRSFWSKRYADMGNSILRKTFKTLLEDDNTVWKKTPWELDLKPLSKKTPEKNSPKAAPKD
jgi:hypothetical protein